MKIKRFAALAVAFVMLFSAVTPVAFAQASPGNQDNYWFVEMRLTIDEPTKQLVIGSRLNGQPIIEARETIPPVIIDGVPMLPLALLAERANAQVSVSGTTATITSDREFTLSVGSDELIVNGVSSRMEAAPALVNGNIMVDIHSLPAYLFYEVEWNAPEIRLTRNLQTASFTLEVLAGYEIDFSVFGAVEVRQWPGDDFTLVLLDFNTVLEARTAFDALYTIPGATRLIPVLYGGFMCNIVDFPFTEEELEWIRLVDYLLARGYSIEEIFFMFDILALMEALGVETIEELLEILAFLEWATANPEMLALLEFIEYLIANAEGINTVEDALAFIELVQNPEMLALLELIAYLIANAEGINTVEDALAFIELLQNPDLLALLELIAYLIENVDGIYTVEDALAFIASGE